MEGEAAGLGEPQTVWRISQSHGRLGHRTFMRGCLVTVLLTAE